MNLMFMALGLIDTIAGLILFTQPSVIVSVIAVILMTKGVVTFVKALK